MLREHRRSWLYCEGPTFPVNNIKQEKRPQCVVFLNVCVCKECATPKGETSVTIHNGLIWYPGRHKKGENKEITYNVLKGGERKKKARPVVRSWTLSWIVFQAFIWVGKGLRQVGMAGKEISAKTKGNQNKWHVGNGHLNYKLIPSGCSRYLNLVDQSYPILHIARDMHRSLHFCF